MSDFSDMAQAGAALVLANIGEALTIYAESAVNYDDDGAASFIWDPGTAVVGAWQPVSGKMIHREAGLSIKSTAQVMLAVSTAVNPGDRIFREDGTWKYVNYVMEWAGHKLAMMVDTKGNQ